MSIRAPYNFVPVSDKVFFPEWANNISHDIPFSDGEDGSIELLLTAQTDIFVRNGHSRDTAKDSPEYLKFSNIKGKYFIPSTSVKGSIRNVLEILSFGKISNVSNDRYSFRDLHHPKYLEFFQGESVHCGWMKQIDDNTIEIEDCGIPRRISHKDLDKIWNTDFNHIFRDRELLKNDQNRTALFKINKAIGKQMVWNFSEIPMNKDNQAVDKRIKVYLDENGPLRGAIVMTGQPSVRKDKVVDANGVVQKKGEGKCYEFVFPETIEGYYSYEINSPESIYRDFCFNYKDSDDWKYWKKIMEKGGRVPVFFSLKNNKPAHFGLSYLYKLPFKKRIREFLPEQHSNENLDMSECIFGVSDKKQSLKGRVQFSHCFLEDGIEDRYLSEAYLGSPKPTYYPIYLVQKGRDGYPDGEFDTMMNPSAIVKGWKRYPVLDEIRPFQNPDGVKAENLNPFFAIQKGAKFSCKIRVHNLRKAELGALLYSINPSKTFNHSIGFAKSFGFGRLNVEIENLKGFRYTEDEYTNVFKELMETNIPDYTKSEQINELRLMGIPQTLKITHEYMPLKEFVDHKRQKFERGSKQLVITGQYLEYYSQLIERKESIPEPEKEFDVAEITYFKYPVFQAKLLSGNDLSAKNLIDFPENVKLKKGNQIIVKKVMKGSNIDKLIFHKLKP